MNAGLPGDVTLPPERSEQRFFQRVEEYVDQRLAALEQEDSQPMCQDAACEACQADSLHDAFQRGGARMMVYYERIPGVAKLREMALLMQTPIRFKE